MEQVRCMTSFMSGDLIDLCSLLSLIYMQEYWNGTGSMHDLLHVWCFPHLGSKDSCLQQSSTIWSPVQHDEPLDG